jgi:hypothetical protein
LVLYGAPGADALGGDLRVGVAKADITPKNFSNMNPMGGSFTGVHDPIYARALLLQDGRNTAAIISLDVIETGDTMPLRRRIDKELGIAADHVLITATHDHSAPRLGEVTPGAQAHPGTVESDAYTRLVDDVIIDSLKRARATLQPAALGLDRGHADVNVNRDLYTPRGWTMGFNAEGPSDKTVWVIKFVNSVGDPIAVLFNYAVHSTATLGTQLVSGDIAGAAERYVEQHYGGKLVALWTLGPAGDQNPRFAGGEPQGIGRGVPDDPRGDDARRLVFEANDAQGFMVGAEVVRVANTIQRTDASARIEAEERVFSCPLKRAVNQMADMKQADVASIPIHLGLIMINDIALTGVSAEIVTNIYWHLKRASPLTDTILMTIANDRIGYVADDAAYDTPIFEVGGSPAARGCAEDGIVGGLVDMIKMHLH